MATYKSYFNNAFSPDSLRLECDICGSADIVDTIEGYVCRECGIVLEIQKLQYHKPYNEEKIQYAPLSGRTQIGNSRERFTSPISEQLARLNRQNSIISNEQAIFEKAETEISRIFSELNLSGHDTIKKMVLEKFREIRPKLRKGIKYRNPEKLVAIISYLCLKVRNISVNALDLIENSMITKKEFNDFCLQIIRYIPEYKTRNRQKYILDSIFGVSQHFGLDMDYFHLARKILLKLWNSIKNSTDNAVTGLVSSISLLCSHNTEITVSAICTWLGIRMSTVQAQVKKKIFERFRMVGFISLIKSRDLLIEVMEKLGILESEPSEPQEICEDGNFEIIEIEVVDVKRIYNAIEDREYLYSFFAIKSENNSLIFINPADYVLNNSAETDIKSIAKVDIKFLTYRYPPPVGPPP